MKQTLGRVLLFGGISRRERRRRAMDHLERVGLGGLVLAIEVRERLQDAQGRVWMQRPGRFRWDYETPYRQLIVADGEHLWTYDEDLEQATVEPVDDALSSTPAMLLSGFRPLDEVMRWQETGTRDGRTWYRLDPKQQDTAVEEVQIAFDAGQLAIIEVRDGFGNHTRIGFSDITRNQSIDPDRFRIQLPPGTHTLQLVLGDAGPGSRKTCHIHGIPHTLNPCAAVGVPAVYDERPTHSPGDSLSIQQHRSCLNAILSK